jgi:hypothetical protein
MLFLREGAKMNKNIKKWVEALRSGEYRQTRGKLRTSKTNGGYCCLGVLCDVFQKETGVGEWKNSPPYQENMKFLNQAENPPIKVRKWVGLNYKEMKKLIALNDGSHYNFAKIADYIEKNIK